LKSLLAEWDIIKDLQVYDPEHDIYMSLENCGGLQFYPKILSKLLGDNFER